MSDLMGREHRLLDLSKVRDARYKGAGIYVGEDNGARCSAVLSEWIAQANTTHGGSSPFPYGIYLFRGEPGEIQDAPEDLLTIPFLEMLPCDQEDPRAVKLTWNESGTEAKFSFTAVGATLGIDPPRRATLWIEAIAVTDRAGKPVMALPLGDRIKRQPVHESAASRQDGQPT